MKGLVISIKILNKELFTPKLFCSAKQYFLVFTKGCFNNYYFKITISSMIKNFVKTDFIDTETPLNTEVTLIINNVNMVPFFNSFSITV